MWLLKEGGFGLGWSKYVDIQWLENGLRIF
jgi:hypothetical protein